MSGTGVNDKSLTITANADISASFSNRREHTTDLSIVFEEQSLGSEYVIASASTNHGEGSQFSVRALVDGTVVTFTLPDGQTGSVTLDAGETYKFASSVGDPANGIGANTLLDLTGTLINASADVAVFAGHDCADVPITFSACDHVFEQMPPVKHLSTEYVVGEAFDNLDGPNQIRVVAARDGTEVTVDGAVVATIDAGEFYSFLTGAPAAVIETSKPALVTQFLVGIELAGEGDPAMSFVPGTDTWLTEYEFANPTGSAAFGINKVNVIIPTAEIATLEINGQPVDSSLFTAIAGTNLSVANIDVQVGRNTASANAPFQLSLFGYAEADSYLTFAAATFASGTVNAPPTAIDDTALTNMGTAIAIDVIANDSDIDGGNFRVVGVGDVLPPSNGTVDIKKNGTPNNPLDDSVVYTPDAGFYGSDTFSYTIGDGQGGQTTAYVTVEVNAPPVAVDDLASTDADQWVEIDVIANDSDVDGGALRVVSVGSASNGSVNIKSQGTPNNPLDDTVVYTPDAGFSGVDTFTYTVGDGQGGQTSATVTVTVNGPPSVSLSETSVDIDENNDPTASLKVADIVISDDGIGTNLLELAGDDADRFEIVSSQTGFELHLKAGEVLDFELDAKLDVTVRVNDPNVGGNVDDEVDFELNVQNVNEIMETGQLLLSDAPQTINLLNTYVDPVVVAFVETRWGPAPVNVRVLNSGTDTIEIALQEPDNEDGTHGDERVSYVVIEAGNWKLPDGTRIEAGKLNTDKLSTAGFERVDFDTDFFFNRPAVLSQVQTNWGPSWVTTRLDKVDETGFEIAMQEEEAGNSGQHASESLGYIAIGLGAGSHGDFEYFAGSTAGFTDSNKTVNVPGFTDGDPLQVVAQLSTFYGADPAFARGRGTTDSSFTAFVQEEVSFDSETAHNAREGVDWFAFSKNTATPGEAVVPAVPEETCSHTDTLPLTGQDIGFSLTLPDKSSDPTVTATGLITTGAVQSGGLPNVAVVVDISGSTGTTFSGQTNVGDVNGDGYSNTILDAEIAAIMELVDSLRANGLDAAKIGLIEFGSGASIEYSGRLDADVDKNGVLDVIDAAVALRDGGSTYFDRGLQSAINFFNDPNTDGNGGNYVFFLSDGYPNGGNYADESETLRDPTGINAEIRAFGVGSGASEQHLDLLDDGLNNGSATIVLDPSTLDTAITGSGVDPASILSVQFWVNGSLQTSVGSASLVDTPFGLRYTKDISLVVGADDTVRVVALVDQDGDGASDFTIECTQTVEEIGGPVNQAPTVALSTDLLSMDENNDPSVSTKVADIIVSDDGLGTNTLSLSGADAARFEIVENGSGPELHLKAGEVLDFELTAQLDVTVEVDDPSVGTTPDDTADFTLEVNDVNEIMETGSVLLDTNGTTIDLLNTYADPVVVAFVETRWGPAPVNVRVLDTGANTIEIALQEPDNEDGSHGSERVSYMVVESGNFKLPDGTRIEAGSLFSDKLSTAGFEHIDFGDGFFANRPTVLSQVQTNWGASFVTTREKNIGADGFEITMQEEEAGNAGQHASEKLGYVAIGQGAGSHGAFEFFAGTANGIRDAVSTVPVPAFSDGNDVQVVAGVSSFWGADPAFARGKGTTPDGFDVFVQEDTSADAETRRGSAESVDYFAFSADTATPGEVVNIAPELISGTDITVMENRTPLARLQAEDRNGDPISFSIAGSGSDDALFRITPNFGGLSFRKAPDFENPGDSNADNVYEVDIRISDGQADTVETIMVEITDRNETPFITSTDAFIVAQGQTDVGKLSAIDPDGDAIIFSLNGSGEDDGKFNIDANTGELAFRSSARLGGDYDGDNIYEIVVEATDPGGRSDLQMIEIEVANYIV